MHEPNGQPPGPSKETLSHLKGMLPSFAKGIVEKSAIGKGRKEVRTGPRKVCFVCGRGFDLGPLVQPKPEAGNCEECSGYLEDGFAALVCGDKYAFVMQESLSDWAGKIVSIGPAAFLKVQEKFKGAVKDKVKGADNAGTLPAGDSGAV